MSNFTFFLVILGIGAVLYFLLRGKKDPIQAVGAPKKTMSTRPVDVVVFPCPMERCPVCAGAAEKMGHSWDGLRKVTWTCGYCGHASVQELKDEELPLSAKLRLGM
jgi:hypothetical protein